MRHPCPWLGVFLLALASGCEGDPSAKADNGSKERTKTAEATRKQIGPNVFFEKQGEKRRVLVHSVVVLREGQLEGLLCPKGTKEHEYILASELDPRHIHAALLAAGGKPGSPVKFEPKYQAATGTTVKITLQYENKGKLVNVPAQQWIRNAKDKKDLDINWVFGGSKFVPDPQNPNRPPLYLAKYGDVICVCNMDDAMLDLPIISPKKFEDRTWEAHKERIPTEGTKVTIILEPVLGKK
jgi:hypothetical protein